MRRSFGLAVVLASFANLLAACHEPPARRPRRAPAPTFGDLVPASSIAFRFEGRVDVRDRAAPKFAWPASGVRLAFRGTGLSLAASDTLFQDDVRDTDYLAVYVDDRAPITVALHEGRGDYPIVRGLTRGDHQVRILKRSESEAGTVTIHGLRVEGRGAFLPAPARKRLSLLAIGDSITAGYGIDGPNEHCHYGSGTSNATRTYAFLAARTLDAEYEAVAWSGRGVYRNFASDAVELVPALYDRLNATDPAVTFDPRTHPADAIVVNLGTNDLSQPRPDRGAFVRAYRAFVERLRADHPSAAIVLVVGPMLADDYPPRSMALFKARRWITGVVMRQRASGDRRIAFLEIPGASPDEGYGCDYHPSLKTHQRMATLLVETLRPMLR